MSPQSSTPQSHPTLADVAAIAGVSVKTASRVLNESMNVSEVTAAKVQQAANLLGYRSNRLARELRTGTLSNLIGMIVSDLANPFYAGLASGAEEELSKNGLDLLLATSRDDGERERLLVDSLLERRVRGLIIVPSAEDYSYLHTERKRGVSIVFVDRPGPYLDADSVLSDNQGGIATCIDRLIAQRCKSIALIADNAKIWTASQRIEGFKRAQLSRKLDPALSPIVSEIHTIDLAEKAARELLLRKNPVDGIVASNDLIAIGVAHAVASLGAQCKVVSFDDFATSKLMNVPTLDHDPRRLGALAAESLMRRIKNPTEKNFGEVLMKLSFREEPIKAVTSNG